MEPLIIIGVIALVAVIGYFAWQAEKKRREAFQIWASKHGWRYSHAKDRSIYRRFDFLDKLNQGSNRYATHVVEGQWQGSDAIGFSFHWETHSTDSKGNRQTHHHWVGVVAMQIEKRFPELKLSPESFLHRIGHALGAQDIDFESIEFSKKFEVKADDKKFAYDFCNTGMMEYLLQHPKTALELDEDWIAVFDSNKLEPHEVEPLLEHIAAIRSHMPDYLFRD
jgi:hypothetical protein